MKIMSLLVFLFPLIAMGSSIRDFDHSKVVGPGKCLECHKKAGAAWQNTHHFDVYKKFHRKKEAKAIAKAMGVKRIKNDSTCMQCHYTVDASKKPIAGISCESCHGPAKDWVSIHNDYGGKEVKKEQETPEHAKQRIANAKAKGMIHPSNIYDVAANCFQCHTVPHEKLVEVGGHKAGSDFELVSWSQGEIRHNYETGKGSNAEASAERKRVLYVIGRILDLEYGLRGVAEITKKSDYAVKMAKRVKRALGYLKQINDTAPMGEVKAIWDLGKTAKLKPNNKAELTKVADQIRDKAKAFINSGSLASAAALDALIPSDYKGTPTP